MSATPAPAAAALDRRTLVTVFVLIVGGLAVIFDSTIVSVALDTIARELGVPISTVQWVSTGYLLALGVAIPIVGWAQARLGGKRLWMLALTVFLVASIACSLAWDASSLIAFRVVQGLGGGLMMPLMTMLALQQVGAGGRAGLGKLMAIVSLPMALGPILGPTIGGVILEYLDWSWLFWVNVPFCLVGLALAWKFLPADRTAGRAKLDMVGLLLLSPGLVGVLFGLSNAGDEGGFARIDVWGPLAAGAVLVAAFVAWALPRPNRALVDVRLFGKRAVGSSSMLFLLAGASLYGAMLLLPLYFQNIQGLSALEAGLVLIPQGVGTLLTRVLAGRLTDSVGGRWVALVGFAVMGAATVPFAFADADTSIWLLMGVLLVRGMGLGAVMIPVMSVAYVGLDNAEVPHASIVTRLAQQLGGAFGTALLAVILEANLVGAVDAADAADAFDAAFWWAVGFTVVAMGLTFLLPGRTAVRAAAAAAEEREAAAALAE
ncbi:MDR family MFS transporter [Agromyces seonyuensis]|uniref:DHA2 family efflux MFS transporter permease subunit n=1 Tax=Agromyces seonyuensis TaxID=2662446 RepID=A0A6I4P567_9MICO|nr:MDR family MFS transporter [Agromyces seonyuensis]MWB98544.1 DHA2 family efflux MFS transporter permease subunit [Agromyces seonyuensis]